jgi:hypothetical protein
MLFPKKINVKSMGLNVALLEAVAEANQKSPTAILRVWGMVNDKKPGTSQFGPFIEFRGEIAALNLLDLQEARSQKLLLPQTAESLVNAVFDKACKDGSAANIGLEITVEYRAPRSDNDKSTRFAYGVKPLFEFKGEDALTAMAKQFPAPKIVKMLTEKKTK